MAGVVTRRAYRAKSVFRLAPYDRISGRQRGPSSAAYRVPGARVHGGVGVEVAERCTVLPPSGGQPGVVQQ